MIGDLLEYAIDADSIATVMEFYRSLGFREARVGDIVNEPYSALCAGGTCIGLRRTGFAGPVPTFVRPDLKDYLRGLRKQKISLEFARLDDDQFHRAGFQDPNGQRIELFEARTYAPLADEGDTAISVAGEFLEFSLPTHVLEESLEFWEKLGITRVGEGASPAPWARIRGHGLTMGLYTGTRFAPGLCFECTNLGARAAFLDAMGFNVRRGAPFGEMHRDSLTLEAPDKQLIYMLEKIESPAAN